MSALQKEKTFTFDMRLCTLCQICELACSFEKTGILGTASSRIHIPTAFGESLGGTKPAICRHCEKPVCMAVCKVGAIKKDQQTGLVAVDEELCVGCMDCIAACPFGAASWDPANKAIAMCDQCGTCVEWCPPKAINFVDRPGIIREKKAREIAKPDIEREGERWPPMPEEGLKYETEELARTRKLMIRFLASEGITGYEKEPTALPPGRMVVGETKRPRGRKGGKSG